MPGRVRRLQKALAKARQRLEADPGNDRLDARVSALERDLRDAQLRAHIGHLEKEDGGVTVTPPTASVGANGR